MDTERVFEAIHDMPKIAESVQRTIDDLLLSGAYNVYVHGSQRGELKLGDSAAEEELYTRWQQGVPGMSKAGTRIHAKNAMVDAANYGASMGNQTTQEKEEAKALIREISSELNKLSREQFDEGDGSSIIDLLTHFDDTMYDLHWWAVRDPVFHTCTPSGRPPPVYRSLS